MRLFLNPSRHAYLRELAGEFDLSPSQIGEELKLLNNAGLLNKSKNGRQINYQANQKHPLFPELQSIVKKSLGIDHILESMINRQGNLELALLIDDYAEGKDTGIIDLLLVGNINQESLTDLTKKTELYIERKIRTLVLTNEEFKKMSPTLNKRPQLILWQQGID
jgi:DNA-binding transcriptional ArsR family regulator